MLCAASGGGEGVADWLIDARRFVAERAVLEGQVPAGLLSRLCEEVEEPPAPFKVRVEGLRSPRGKDGLVLTLEGRVRLICQRCMKPVDLELSPTARFELVSTEAELDADEDDEWDPLMAAERLDLLPVIEDELLLALPYAPMHDRCEPVGRLEAGERVMPFAALGALKKSRP